MKIAEGQYTVVDLYDPIQQDTPPASPVDGMLWLDTGVDPPLLKYNSKQVLGISLVWILMIIMIKNRWILLKRC